MHISLHMHTYVCTFVCMRNTYLHSYMLVSGQVSVPTPTCAVLLFVRHSSRCPWCYKACTEASGLLTVVCVVVFEELPSHILLALVTRCCFSCCECDPFCSFAVYRV